MERVKELLGVTVVGCVWGAHRRLKEQLGDDAPSYEWCEARWREVRKDAPKPGKDLPGWLDERLAERLP